MGEKYNFSLLWPDYLQGRRIERDAKSGKNTLFNRDLLERDINMDMILDGMEIRNDSRGYIKARMLDLVTDAQIIKYRQDILQDFMAYTEIEQSFDQTLLPLINSLKKMEKQNIGHDQDMRKIAWRVDMLKIYIQSVDVLYNLFCSPDRVFMSEGIHKLQDMLKEIHDTEGYSELKATIPDLYDKIQGATAVTVGINLDSELHPKEAILLSVEPKPFKNKAFMTSILGRSRNDETYMGLGSFYSINKDNKANALDAAIIRDLEDVFSDGLKAMAAVIGKFEYIEAEFLFELLPEVYYYIGGSRLANTLSSTGLPVCIPVSADKDLRIFKVKDVYDASFAIRIKTDMGFPDLSNFVVTNDAEMSDEAGRIFILTGANQGGKTTFTRAVGITQLLYQAGFPIPASEGIISPVDNIYTHFPELEKNSVSEGRLGEECIRLETILPRLSKYSMILMNESLSSTSHQECLVIAEEIMKFLRKVGARCVFATHIHELAEEIPELNKEPALSDLVSLVAGVDETQDMQVLTEEGIKKYAGNKRTYKIIPMPPQGKSFALDIAKTYGISYDQLLKTHDEKYADFESASHIIVDNQN